jgi:hypothetical protein
MSEDTAPEIGPQQVDRVLEFLPAFESPGYRFGEWGDSGYFSYSPEVDDFIKTLYEQDILVDFDWVSWKEEAQRYQSKVDALQQADLLTLRKLLTVHVRADRFTKGHLASVLESGHITAILSRLEQIRDQMLHGG